MFRLRLLHIRRSDFAFIWIRCSDFICITFASAASQTFRLRLLHIRRLDFAFIWIRCSDFICIFASSADQTFRLRLLRIRRSDFALISIKCLHLICITFASIANQTFRLRLLHKRSHFAFIGSYVQTPSVSRLLASHFKRSDFASTFYILDKGVQVSRLCFLVLD